MASILHDFPINAAPEKVFSAVTTPEGLDQWWTKESAGKPEMGQTYKLWFGPEYAWQARVTRCSPGQEFELHFTEADEDWTGTKVGFRFQEESGTTQVSFYHTGWPATNRHYRRSSYCWAMYLRVLRRHLESGESVRYEDRLDV
jgi:uncharacterized protein YndB with AHSA1/START domain